MLISSTQNPRVKAAMRLRDRRHRDRERMMLVEGHDELALAIDAGVELVTLFIASGPDAGARKLLAAIPRNAEVIEATPEVFARLAYRQNPDGWLAVVRTPDRDLDRIDPGQSPLVLVIDGVEKPGNLGAMLRTADACRVDAVLLSDAGTDPWNPNVVRASKGAVFSVPLALAPRTDVLRWLEERSIELIAADPGTSLLHTSVDLTGPVAVVVGAEDVGLSQGWREAASRCVSIPMAGRVNSLNVATSAALLLYEAVRQRAQY